MRSVRGNISHPLHIEALQFEPDLEYSRSTRMYARDGLVAGGGVKGGAGWVVVAGTYQPRPASGH